MCLIIEADENEEGSIARSAHIYNNMHLSAQHAMEKWRIEEPHLIRIVGTAFLLGL